jgi:hypothetical protein
MTHHHKITNLPLQLDKVTNLCLQLDKVTNLCLQLDKVTNPTLQLVLEVAQVFWCGRRFVIGVAGDGIEGGAAFE